VTLVQAGKASGRCVGNNGLSEGTIAEFGRSLEETRQKERAMMGNTNKPEPKKLGEKKPGKYHYNPGNMSGKTIDIAKDESDQKNNIDRVRSRDDRTRTRE
jgi:hypothetical protein